jgi:hypothetical protein
VRAVWAGLFAGIAEFCTLSTGVWTAPNYAAGKAAAIALIPAVLAAAFDAAKNALLSDGSRLKG